MADPAPPSQTTTPWPRARGARAERGGHRRVRLALYIVFAVLTLAVVVQAMLTLRLEELRSADAEILDRAGLQRTLTQQIGRLAALIVADPAQRDAHYNALAAQLSRSVADALELDAFLSSQIARSPEAVQTIAPILEAWHAAREKLWYRGEVLARAAGGGTAEDLWRRAAAVQAEVEPALAVANKLSTALRAAAQRRAERQRQEVLWSAGALLTLLGLLSITVVEPTARSVARYVRRLAEQSSEVRLLALVAEHTTAVVLITDRDDRIQWVNAAFTNVCGWTLAEVAGRTPPEVLAHPHADVIIQQRIAQALAAGQGARHEWLRRARDGRDVWLDIDLRPLHDEQGALTGFIRVATDVTARVQQQGKLLALWTALPAGVVVQAPDGSIVDANRAAERLLGRSVAELQGRDSSDPRWRMVREDLSVYPGDDFPPMRTLRSGQPLFNETMGVQTPEGQLRWLLVNTEPQRDLAGKVHGVVTCFTDITERRVLQDQLSAHARTDALTRLPNRSVVMERLRSAIDHARRHPGYGFAVLFMDFDRFKQVNDTLGHGAGDELLRQIAGRLQAALRPGDAVARVESSTNIAARLGGDEFVVVLDGVHDLATVQAVTERLLADLAEPYLIGTTPVQSSVSIGVVLSSAAGAWEGAGPSTGTPAALVDLDSVVTAEAAAEQVLRNADTAMYEAKRGGRGRFVLFDNSMHERVVRALEVETDLRRALREDELFVVYQPVVDMADRSPVGVEALVRWRHPQRGLVSPAEFIGVAEECGLIDAVGEVVLRKACSQFVQWRHTLGPAAPRQLAVNMSRAQLKRAGVVDDVRSLLQEVGMPPECLQLEVTESLAAQDERVQATLRELKALGVKLALDDFGTGYSSLACLHLMPVDTVKVDRSFVRHAETVEYHRVLIEATIRVARTLGMKTVAEGIETEGQAELMRRLDCDCGQGFLFARPLEAPELEAWARREAEQLTAA